MSSSLPRQPMHTRPRPWWWLACVLLACAEPSPASSTSTASVAPDHAPQLPADSQAPQAEAEAEPAPPPPPPKSARLELSFVGDIVLGRYRVEHGDWRYREMAAPEADPFAEVRELLAADVVVGNLESPLIRVLPDQSPITHKNRFGAGAQHVDLLVRGGFTVLSLANNHHYDLGVEGQREGPQLLAESGLMPIGAARDDGPVFRVETHELQGWRVGFVAFSTIQNHGGKAGGPKIPRLSLSKVEEVLVPLLADARDDHDLLVVAVHWGEEYAAQQRNTQRIAAHKLLDAGADLIIGHHPHVLQAIERHAGGDARDGLIAYSLGNFMFPRNDGGAEMSAILSASYVDMGEGQRPCLTQARVDPIYISRQPSWRPVPAPHYQRTKVHKRLRELSKSRHTRLKPAAKFLPEPEAELDGPEAHALYVDGLRSCERSAPSSSPAQPVQASSSSAASPSAAATEE